MPYSPSPVVGPVAGVPALICGNRLEPRTRSAEFNRSLRAEVRDAAWMLSRQWQMKEFQAEDRGSPISVSVALEYAPLNQFQIGTGPITTFGTNSLPQPLDALIQAQAPVVDLGMRLQMSIQWTRILRRMLDNLQRTPELLAAFRQRYPLPLPTDASVAPGQAYNSAHSPVRSATAHTTTEAYNWWEINATTGGNGFRAGFDGYSFWQEVNSYGQPADFLADFLLTVAGTAGPFENAVLTDALRAFQQWYERVYFQPYTSTPTPDSWSVPELAYQFKAAVPSSGTEPIVLQAREHLGELMDWYALDEVELIGSGGFSNDPTQVTSLPAPNTTIQSVPTEIQFTGAPNARWWEFEDRQVDFGQITADSSDLGRMLLQEFMFLYHNDWFSFPYTIPTGSLCSVKQITVTDVFGRRYAIEAAGANYRPEPETTELQTPVALDNDWGRWSLYALSKKDDRQHSSPRVLLPPTAIGTLVGPVLEQVYLAREEATNLVWGVEQIIPDELGRGMDGQGAAARVTEQLRALAQPVTSLATSAKLEFKLSTPTAENWIPFVPHWESTADASQSFLALEQGEMLRQVDGLTLVGDDARITPRTTLLQYPETAYLIHERQVPPVGVRIESNFRRARWFNGTTVTWYGRQRGNGRNGGSSGLVYDQLLPREPRSTAAQFLLVAAQYLTTAEASGIFQLAAIADAHPLISRVQLYELNAAGSALLPPQYPLLDISRAQLVSMLENQDVFFTEVSAQPLALVTVDDTAYIQLPSPPTNYIGDWLDTVPAIPPPLVVIPN